MLELTRIQYLVYIRLLKQGKLQQTYKKEYDPGLV